MEPTVRIVCEGCLRSVEIATEETHTGESRCPYCGHLICSQPSGIGPDGSRTASPESRVDSQPTEVGETIDWFNAWERGTLGSMGRFQLRERLGDGGFGQVFLAFDPRLDRDVAIKVLKQANPNDRVMERFFREARAVARLDHPNIATVYDAGVDEGRCWVAYQYVSGRPLWWYRDRQPMDATTAARIIRQLADALDHAHNLGVVHRDLKPANVIIDDHGEPRLIDFGLARRFDLGSDLTREGAVVGTPAYMSPEQAIGMSRQADERSDVYSLGVILHELICRQRPQDARTELTARPPGGAPGPSMPPQAAPGRPIDPSIPAGLGEICAKAMCTRPSDRHVSARALADELDRWLKQRAQPGHRLLMVVPGALMILTGVILAAWGVWMGGRARALPPHGSPDSHAASFGPDAGSGATELANPGGAAKSAPETRSRETLIGNWTRKSYHRSWCKYVGQMNEENRVPLASPEEASKKGYAPCNTCRPDRITTTQPATADGAKAAP